TDSVHLVWNAPDQGDRMHVWSIDGGETWSTPRPIGDALRGGNTGPPSIVVDAAHMVHVFTVVTGASGGEELAHLTLDGAAWSAPEWLSDGIKRAESIRRPAAVVAAGNRLYVAFQAGDHGVYVNAGRVDAPVRAPRPVPTMPSGVRAWMTGSSTRLRVLV